MKKILYLSIVVILTSCMPNKNKSKEINIYSQRHYNVDELQYQNFEKMTGIKVNVTKANADELIQRLKNEGENSPADLFITVDVGKLWQASDMGLFQKLNMVLGFLRLPNTRQEEANLNILTCLDLQKSTLQKITC